MADNNTKWDDDETWGQPLSDEPADVAARDEGRRQMLSSTQRLLRWSYVVLLVLVIAIVWLALR
jgi:hypothetical protein